MSGDDLLQRAERWLQLCPSCDAGLAMSCTCPSGDPRNIIADLAAEVRRLRGGAQQ